MSYELHRRLRCFPDASEKLELEGTYMSGGLIIFGRQTKKDYGPTALVTCPNCRNKTYFVLVYIKTWLEYFFIKIFPYKRRYYLLCNICSRGVELKGQQIDAAKKLNEATLAYLNKSLSTEQYQTIVNEVGSVLEVTLEVKPTEAESLKSLQ